MDHGIAAAFATPAEQTQQLIFGERRWQGLRRLIARTCFQSINPTPTHHDT